MANRLFVESIFSIGLVARGDNDPAEVLIYKARDFDKKRREPTLGDYRQQLAEISKERRHDQEVDRIENRPKDTNMPSNTPATDALIARIEKDRARARGEEVADDFDEVVAKKLDAWAGRVQIQNEMSGKWGSMSTPRPEQRVKIKVAWWQSPDGQLVKDKLRDKTSAGQDGELIVKSLDGETAAAIARLDA